MYIYQYPSVISSAQHVLYNFNFKKCTPKIDLTRSDTELKCSGTDTL